MHEVAREINIFHPFNARLFAGVRSYLSNNVRDFHFMSAFFSLSVYTSSSFQLLSAPPPSRTWRSTFPALFSPLLKRLLEKAPVSLSLFFVYFIAIHTGFVLYLFSQITLWGLFPPLPMTGFPLCPSTTGSTRPGNMDSRQRDHRTRGDVTERAELREGNH